MQRTTNSIHKVSRLLLGGDARSVSAAPASAGLRQPSENEAVLKAFNHEVLVVKSRRETRGWEVFNVRRATHSPVCRSRHQLPPFPAHGEVASCGYQVQQSQQGPLKIAARLQFPVYSLQPWHPSDLYAERLWASSLAAQQPRTTQE